VWAVPAGPLPAIGVIQINARPGRMRLPGSVRAERPDPPERGTAMADLCVSESLWTTSLMPEGVLERWLVGNGSVVTAGQAVAAVRIGDALHDIVTPAAGRLDVLAVQGELVDPGCIIAEIHHPEPPREEDRG
jgi:biotin carboxyl carrier protein